MSIPSSRQDLTGNLVLSGSSDLNIPVGVNISTGTASTSTEILLPNPGTQIALVAAPCGSLLCQMSIYSVTATPNFAAPTDSKTTSTSAASQIFLLGQSTSTNKYLQLRITNNSGVSLAPAGLVLLSLQYVLSPLDLLSGVMANAGSVVNSTHYGVNGSPGNGQFGLTSGN